MEREHEVKYFLEMLEKLENTDQQQYEGFYNGYALMNSKDLNGEVPEIFICSGNRTAGKTFFFKRLITRYALLTHTEFLFMCRKKTQLSSVGKSFIDDISECPDFTEHFKLEGSDMAGVKEIFYGETLIGYITYLNYADDIKEASNMFNNVSVGMKDEFQCPNPSSYVENEVQKVRSIHKSCARGYGKRSRFLPFILVSNQISIINPYFVAFGIHRRFSKGTRKMRGNGWVFNLVYNEMASCEGQESAFERAFGEDEQALSDNFNRFMDNLNMVGKENTSNMRLFFIFYVKKCAYGLWGGNGFMYVSTKADKNFKRKYALDIESHTEDTILIQRFDPVFMQIRKYFENGFFRFESVDCRVALVDALACSVL